MKSTGSCLRLFHPLLGLLLWWGSVPSASFPGLSAHLGTLSSSRFLWARTNAHRPSVSKLSMLRRMDKQIDGSGDSDSEPEPGSSTLKRNTDATSKEVSDFSGWKISTKKKLPGLCDLADEIENWILRVELGGRYNGGLDNASRAIVAEFENERGPYEMPQLRLGGAAGEMAIGQAETWFKDSGGSRDTDPSGVLRVAEENIKEAQRRNMSYVDYIRIHVQKPIVPTVEIVRPHARTLPAGTLQLVTTPHSYPVHTQLPRVPYSTCWYGLFFEVEALERDVEITALYTQSGLYHSEKRDLANVSVYTRDGPAAGHELSRGAWTLAGWAEAARLVRVNLTTNTDPAYGRLPLDAPLRVAAGERRGFLVHTTQERGVALRARTQGVWRAGEVTDRDGCVAVRAGLLPCGDDLYDHALHGGASLDTAVFDHVYSPDYGAAFVGVIDYRLL